MKLLDAPHHTVRNLLLAHPACPLCTRGAHDLLTSQRDHLSADDSSPLLAAAAIAAAIAAAAADDDDSLSALDEASRWRMRNNLMKCDCDSNDAGGQHTSRHGVQRISAGIKKKGLRLIDFSLGSSLRFILCFIPYSLLCTRAEFDRVVCD